MLKKPSASKGSLPKPLHRTLHALKQAAFKKGYAQGHRMHGGKHPHRPKPDQAASPYNPEPDYQAPETPEGLDGVPSSLDPSFTSSEPDPEGQPEELDQPA